MGGLLFFLLVIYNIKESMNMVQVKLMTMAIILVNTFNLLKNNHKK